MQFFLKLQQKLKERKGFTLIELLIVIAILAILALLGLPRLATFRTDAQAREIISTGETIGRAAEAYIASLPAGTTYSTTEGDYDDEVQPYLDSETQTRLGTGNDADFNVAVDANGVVTVIYNGTSVDSNAIGDIDDGDTLYPEFTATS